MYPVKKMKAQDIFPVIGEVLAETGSVWITVTGTSMYPFLRNNMDQVLLDSCKIETLKIGDIVLIKRNGTDEYVLHRIVHIEAGHIYIIGDAQQWLEGPIEATQILAVVSKIRRKNHVIKCTSPFYTSLVFVWLKVIPLRYKILKLIRGFKKISGFVFKNTEKP